jgi:protein-tyrosine phosphatase
MLHHSKVDRLNGSTVRICCETQRSDLPVSIFKGDSPDAIDLKRPIATLNGEKCVEVPEIGEDVRAYFKIVPQGGSGIVVAERRVPFQGTVNFRDLGGYETTSGKRVRWGTVFRSDSLARLTMRDQGLLIRMGMKVVFDFRTPNEVKKAPDLLPEHGQIDYVHLPVVHGEFDSVAALKRLSEGDASWLTENFMVDGYLRNIEEFADVWGVVINRLAETQNRPLVFHCTGGKDRAGVCAALVLLALGVPEETVVYDHGLSNIFIAEVLKKINTRIKSFGVDPERVAPYFTAPRTCILAFLSHIRKAYGSAGRYLREKAGVSDEKQALLKEALLE